MKRAGYNAKLAAENVGTGQVVDRRSHEGLAEQPRATTRTCCCADASDMGIALVQDNRDRVQDVLDAGRRIVSLTRRDDLRTTGAWLLRRALLLKHPP